MSDQSKSAGFLPGNSATARSIGYEEEKSPTLKGSCDVGVVCLNDQGGSVMGVDEDKCATLRAEAHGNNPIVFEPGIASRDGGHIYTDGKSPTLRASPGDNFPTIAYSFDSKNSNSMKSPNPESGCREVETAKTLDTSSQDPSKNQGGIAVAYCIAGNTIDRKIENGGNGMGAQEELSYTLNTVDRHAVACVGVDTYNGAITGDKACTLTSASGAPNTSGPKVMVMGVDAYNGKITGDTAATLTAEGCSSAGHSGPSVAYCMGHDERSAQFTPNVADPLTASDFKQPQIVSTYPDKAGTLCASDAKGKNGQDAYNDKLIVQTYCSSKSTFHTQFNKNIAPTLVATDYKEPPTVFGIGRDAYNMGQNAKFAMSIEEDVQPTLTARGPGAVAQGIITYDVTVPVMVRKHKVDTEGLKKLLREAMKTSGLSRKDLAEKLNLPQTQIDHWFRTDNCFAVPDKDVWFKLKELLDIKTDEYDAQVTEFVEADCSFDSQNRIYDARGIAPTLTSTDADKTILDAPDKAGTLVAGYFKCWNDNPFERGYTVCQTKAVDVRNSKESSVNGTLQSRSSNNLQSNNVVRQEQTVRRLTPIECERLQGLSDNYTFLPWEKTCSDSARYKALGNGMAQPCADFIIRRIAEVEREEENNV